MSFFDTNHQRAAWLVAILGIGIFLALVPYASGLLGAPILYVVFGGLHQWLVPRVRSRALASSIVIVVAVVMIVIPLIWMVSLLVGQAQGAVEGVINSPLLDRVSTLTVAGYPIGPELKAAGAKAVSFLGGGAISFLGTATRLTLNLLFTFFGLYYLLMDPKGAWRGLRPYIPFSDENVAILQERFVAVTKSTIIGTGFSSLTQGILIAIAFQVTGLGNSVFWGVVTVVFSILPVVGGGLVWGPGAIVLYMGGQPAMAIGLAIFGAVIVGNVDNLIRPFISSRYAQIHPLITLVGAIAGVSYIGLLGLLVGPLALSYFFELLTMYRREYLRPGVVEG
jgi:predicted PurR-regulated permease PerM